MKLVVSAGMCVVAAGVLLGCGDSSGPPSQRCAPSGCVSIADECTTDADCAEEESCVVRLDAANTCEPDDEPVACDGNLVLWELSVTEDIPLSDGVLVNELQLKSVDVRASVDSMSSTSETLWDDVPLPFVPEQRSRFSFASGDRFDVDVAVEHPEGRIRTFSCGFRYEELIASQGVTVCVLPVDGETIQADDPVTKVYVKASYDIPNECGVATKPPGQFQVRELRAFELIDHPVTGPGTPRQFGTVDATLTFEATKLPSVSVDDEVPFRPTVDLDLPVEWDGRVSVTATLDLVDGDATMSCALDFSKALLLGKGFRGNDVNRDDPLVVFSESFEGEGEIHCVDANDPSLMMEIDYALEALWQSGVR